MKVALVYDRVNKWGGAERVLLSILKLYPKAHLFTSVYEPQKAPWAKKFARINTSFLQNIPHARSNHEYYALCMPLVFESFDFKNYDLVISVTSEAAKGIITRPETKHVCYLLTPTRYLWSGQKTYFSNPLLRSIASPAVSYLKYWDKRSAHRVDKLITISQEVNKRAKRYYGLDSDVIYPPYDESVFRASLGKPKKRNDNYLLVSRLVSYKKADLAIKAFNEMKLPLTVIGDGRERDYLESIAGETISFFSSLTDSELATYYETSKALIFPQREDFGIVAVEAQAMGLPVIAFGKGGALETVIDGETGILFEKQTKKAIIDATRKFSRKRFKRSLITQNAKRFTEEKFLREFKKAIDDTIRI